MDFLLERFSLLDLEDFDLPDPAAGWAGSSHPQNGMKESTYIR